MVEFQAVIVKKSQEKINWTNGKEDVSLNAKFSVFLLNLTLSLPRGSPLMNKIVWLWTE